MDLELLDWILTVEMVLLRFARIDDVAESLMQPAVFSFACWRMCSRGMQHMDVNVEILLRGMREIHPDRAKGRAA